MRKKIATVTLKDCRVDVFHAGGPGGQNQNKVASGVRITHLASGAVGSARDDRSQHTNKVLAFKRMGKHPKFIAWANSLIHPPVEPIEDWITRQMAPENLLIEEIELD